jgi:hypothetical protein
MPITPHDRDLIKVTASTAVPSGNPASALSSLRGMRDTR